MRKDGQGAIYYYYYYCTCSMPLAQIRARMRHPEKLFALS